MERGFTIVVGALLLFVAEAVAGGPATIRWDQQADCEGVAGWEVMVAPITAAEPDPGPSAARVGASIAAAPPVGCGAGLEAVAVLAGAGRQRVWMVALGVDGSTRSAVSNAVDSTFPLAAPVLVGVGF